MESVVEIPKQYKIICRLCKTEVVQDSANRPEGWARLKFERNGEGWNGARNCDLTVDFLLCASCGEKAAQAINGLKP